MSLPAACGLHLSIALDIASLAGAQRRLGDFLAAGGCGPEVVFRAELVVEEAMMNVIRHAAGATCARLAARCGAGGAQLTIEDDGPEFDPLAAPLRATAGALAGSHEGGFGLHLIRRNADSARYARTGAGMNRLELAFAPRAGR
jgi:sigma-B regulation protein RsbU (phosphoserine phosphatase)